MTVTLPTLTDLDQAVVDQCRQLLKALILEYNPQLTTQRGVISDFVLNPRAVLNAAYETRLTLLTRAGSLLAVSADPAAADAATVDALLSNFRLTRGQGGAAAGPVTVVLSSQTPVVIPQNAAFIINGRVCNPDQVYAARTSSISILGTGDRVLTPFGTGQWAFTINVVDSQTGAAGNARAGMIALLNPPTPRFVKAFVAADFTGGVDVETNAQLLARLQAGLSVQGWSSRAGVEALLRSQAAFAGLKAISVIGFGDAEMRRDQHLLWPGSVGGRCDVYLRTDDLSTTSLACLATLVSVSGTTGTWQFSVGRDDAPGYYEVVKVVPAAADPTAVGFIPVSDVRGLDLTGAGPFPDIANALEAVYSRFQTATVQFKDTTRDASTLTPGVSTAPYLALLSTVPLLGPAHDFLASGASRPPTGDVLVKAPVPCFLSVSFTAGVRRGTALPAAGVIEQAVASFVNGLGFPGQLSGSAIAQVVHNAVPGVLGLSDMDMLGRVRRPDGTMAFIRSGDLLTVPAEPQNGVTGRTVTFFTDPGKVAVTVIMVDSP